MKKRNTIIHCLDASYADRYLYRLCIDTFT